MRLVTRGDMDGLACAVLITTCEKIDEIKLIHPQDITDDRVEILPGDILANVPYHPNAGKWFDHHLLTTTNRQPPARFEGRYGQAPSAARLVYEYYGGDEKLSQFKELVAETDRIDSANLTVADVTDPQGYVLLGYTIDSRTGLGPFQAYFHMLNTMLKTEPIEAVLQHPKVQERIRRMEAEDAQFRDALERFSYQDGNVVITDFRDVKPIPRGNRFLIYTLFPEANVSVRVHWGPEKQFAVAAIGHSIFDRTCQTSIGELCARFGGGGHRGAGTTPLPAASVDGDLAEIVATLKANG